MRIEIYTEMSQQSTDCQRGNLTADLVARWSDAHCKGLCDVKGRYSVNVVSVRISP